MHGLWRMDFKAHCLQIFDEFLVNHPTLTRWHLALSGGLDSSVLLSLLAQWKTMHASISLDCIHVHHGLSLHADEWAQHCKALCEQSNIAFFMEKVTVARIGSLEANARQARYAALESYLPTAQDVLLTAHHQEDQAETFLLQLFRGAGLKGLSAMPHWSSFANGHLFRPLLGKSRAQLSHYAAENSLSWVEDESNENLAFDRNFLRTAVIPVLTQRWPSLAKTITRSASHIAQAQELLTEAFDEHFSQVKTEQANTLLLAPLKQFLPAMQRAILRHWFERLEVPMPSQEVMAQLQKSMLNAKSDAMPLVHWGTVDVRRYQDKLYCLPAIPDVGRERMIWDFPSPVELPDLGMLTAVFSPVKAGLKPPPQHTRVTIRYRQGGEKIQLANRAGHHLLKKLFQEWAIPPWKRQAIALVFYDEELVCVVGYGMAQAWVDDAGGYSLQVDVNESMRHKKSFYNS